MSATTDGDATLAGDEGSSARPSSADGPRWPARLRHYVMLQELGRGGMGVVCAAYDQVLDRKVAIKLLHARGDEQAQVRLMREAQALARLSHPNVVQIYEIGEFEQLAFIVMEFVDGLTLRQWLRSEPRSRAAILAVFDAAGRGLAAAHAQGLVHRDFKPDNVMIRQDGRVLVMDFGLARGEVAESGELPQAATTGAFEQSVELRDSQTEVGATLTGSHGNRLSVDLTRTGSLLGTPAYMAPEQFRGLETNAKTDQFAFCVALWEALSGERPFAGTNVAALSLSVTRGTISTPSTKLPAWIRKHLERGLARDPAQRWPSIEALLAALRDDPTRRRFGLLAVVGVAVIGLGIAFGVDLVRDRELAELEAACEVEGGAIADDWTADDRSAIEQAFLASDLDSAGEIWTRVQSSMDAYAGSWTELRTLACRETRIEHQRTADDYAALAECLDEHRTSFATLVDTWQTPTRRQVAAATSAAASLPPLSTCSDTSLLAARVRLPDDPDTRASVRSTRHRIERAEAFGLALDYDAGLREAEAALAEAETLAWPPLIAEARLTLGFAQRHLGQLEDAHASTKRAFDEAGEAGHDLVALEAADMLIYLVGHKLGQAEPALVWADVTQMLIGRLGLEGSPLEAAWSDHVGIVYDDLGNFEAAREAYQHGLELREAQLGPDNLQVALSLDHLGVLYWAMGRPAEARVFNQRVLAIRENLLGPEHADVAIALDNLGAIQFEEGKVDEAVATFERSLAIWKSILGPDHLDVAITLGNLGGARLERGDLQGALADFAAARAIQNTWLPPEHPDRILTLGNLANVQRFLGDLEPSLANHRRAIELIEFNFGPEHYRLVFHCFHYGNSLAAAGRWVEAESQYERALAVAERAPASSANETPSIHFALAKTLWQLGEQESAREHARIALVLLEDHPMAPEVHAWLAAHQ